MCDNIISLWEGIQISNLLQLNEEVYIYNIFSTVTLTTKFVGMMNGVL
jgi:hypothetical protein